MFIKQLQIKNFKCFKDETFANLAVPNEKKGSGLNILIGENNTGKTTFMSIFFKLKGGSMICDEEKNSGEDVQIVIKDTDDKEKIIKNIISSSNIDLSSNGDSGINYDSIDLVKDNRIWTSNFSGEMPFSSYKQNANFNRSIIDNTLSGALSFIEKNDSNKKLKFNALLKQIIPEFSNWTIKSSSKNGSYISYNLNGGGALDIDFSLGGGILNLFRIILSFTEEKKIIFIDEPEVFLHPKAQEKLLDLLLEESKDRQIFISTHSPYMFKGAIGAGAKLSIFKRNGDKIEVMDARDSGWGVFGKFSPTWGEVNWHAYDLPTIEFHNELYGFLQAKATNEDKKNYYEEDFDSWLKDKLSINQNKTWTKIKKDKTTENLNRTLQTYIRNLIHHPENNYNTEYKPEELRASIQKMIDFCKIISSDKP